MGLILSKVAADSLLVWEPVYERIITARFASKCQNMSKIGNNNTDLETFMGQQGLGSMNENGEILADFCTSNDIVIGGTIFPHKPCHKGTWRSPDARTENQIGHITINRRWRSSLQDVRVRRGADEGSDHHLVDAH